MHSLPPVRLPSVRLACLLCGLALPALSATADTGAARLAVAPRTHLPPEADDPLRPAGLRVLKPGVWVDDVGVDDNGNIYNQYRRSSVGTWSNYDEAKADPFPRLPDPLLLNDGRPVRDAAAWWQRRRPEILEDFRATVFGRVPADLPGVTWDVTTETGEGGVKTKRILGRIDHASFPAATPAITVTLTLPAHAAGPVPVILAIGGRPAGASRPMPSGRAGRPAAPALSPAQQILARGWGYATFDPSSLQPDNAAGLTRGIIGLANRGAARKNQDDWGALSAWAWGLSRAVDYFETDPDVDARRLGVEGHSRWGKTALWAAAQDPRWAIAYVSCSGEGGAKLFRRNYGETTDNIAGSHWMAPRFRNYAGDWDALPVDSHELIALVAPRPVFVTGATQDPWSDPRGEFLALVAAGPVYRLLGAADLGTAKMPAPGVALTSGDLAFREHVGAHTDVPDWPVFLEFAARYLGTAPAAK